MTMNLPGENINDACTPLICWETLQDTLIIPKNISNPFIL